MSHPLRTLNGVHVWVLLHAATRGHHRRVPTATAVVALLSDRDADRFAPSVLDAIAESYAGHVTTRVTAVAEHRMQQLMDNLLPTVATEAEEDHR